MSHIVEVKTQIRDLAAMRAACQRLGLQAPVMGTFQLFSTQVRGIGVQLPGWRFPAVCDLGTGQIQYDNYQGHWGEQRELDRFIQAYAVEKAKQEARRQGHSVTEQLLADGSIKLVVQVSGGAA